MVIVAVIAGVVGGVFAGWAIRLLLARLRRGVVLRPGVAEVGSAVVTGLGVALSWGGPLLAMVIWAGLLAVALGAVDLVHHRLPDALTLPAIPVTAVVVAATGYLNPDAGSLVRGAVVGLVLGGAFWALAALAPRAMGRGDVKLVPSLGLLTGFVSVEASALATVIAFVLGALVAIVGLLARKLTVTSAIPFGPCLLAGCWLVLAVPAVTTWVIG